MTTILSVLLYDGGMSEVCGGCGLNQKTKMSWKWFGTAVFGGLVLALGLAALMNRPVEAKTACLTKEQVEKATVEVGKCLTIFGGGVYDFTTAKKWDLTGHVGKHLCGREYDQQTIEKGPHKVGVIDPFYLTNVCGESASRAPKIDWLREIKAWPRATFKTSWTGGSAYLALIFFLLNFLTCYAMPWARVRQPWEGEVPGHDQKDPLGRFPLTYWHKYFAWLAILFLSIHGGLGFACMWFKLCF